uniref:Uncharacterized protein n=1 Tax=Romanomermis culicivorax TaxID=13658 RepID=A0A915J289_ROMCU
MINMNLTGIFSKAHVCITTLPNANTKRERKISQFSLLSIYTDSGRDAVFGHGRSAGVCDFRRRRAAVNFQIFVKLTDNE